MMIISGVKKTSQFAGYVADFCFYCRDIREVRVDRLQMKKHFYFISYKNDSDPWDEMKCMECGGAQPTEIEDYASLVRKRPAAIEELIKLTKPNIYSEYRERLVLEKEIQRSPHKLDNEQRETLIKEPFKLLAPQIEGVYSEAAHLDLPLLFTFLAGATASIGMFAYALNADDGTYEGPLLKVALFVALFSFAALMISWGFASRRRIKKTFLNHLLSSLRPLKPTRDELEKIRNFYAITKAKIGKKWVFKHLYKQLDESDTEENYSASRGAAINTKVVKGDFTKVLQQKQKK